MLPPRLSRIVTATALFLLLLSPSVATAQTTFVVASDADLRNALNSLDIGDTIVFDANITLAGDLPTVSYDGVTIDGNGFTLSGGGQYRGLFVGAPAGGVLDPVAVTIRNLTIRDTLARGGDGGAGDTGGGGGAGLGGAIFVAENATVTVSNVSVQSSAARGGAGGGVSAGATSGGGGGGLGGNGGTATTAGGGGGGIGRGADGGDTNENGSAGIAVTATPGASTLLSAGGVSGGGGAGGDSDTFFYGGGGGGDRDLAGYPAPGPAGRSGGFGGGGGGRVAGDAGAGGYGGGGGGGATGSGGFGGGAGGTTAGTNAGGFGAGSSGALGGGGGAGMGGAVFVQSGGSFVIDGPFTVNGGAAGTGASAGSAYGSGLFLDGFGTLSFAPAAGQTVTISDAIADQAGVTGDNQFPSWNITQSGPGRTVLRGNNLYAGGTNIDDGILNVASDSNLGVGGDVSIDGGTLEIAASGTYSRIARLQNTGTISVASGATATWAGEVGDVDNPGALVVRGGGTLALTNALNSYTGGTTVLENSTLAVNSDAALGGISSFTNALMGVTLGDGSSQGTLGLTAGLTSSRTIALGNAGGAVAVSGGAAATWVGAVSGSGGFTKRDGGTLELAGTNTYAGATSVAGGTLRAGSGSAFGTSSVMSVAGGATLDLNGFSYTFNTLSGDGDIALGSATLTTSDGAVNGVISGSGGLVKNGPGTFTLGGANTYAGGTTVNGGTLAGTSTSLRGSILNNANVSVDQNFDGAFTGTMTGSGSLTKNGSGTLTLAGPQSFTGGIVVNGGTLAGSTSSLRGSIASSATVRFNQVTDGVFDGLFSGTGGITKTGAGRMTVSGNHSLTGLTDIQQGVLALDGALAGSAAVRSGAIFTMNGSMGGAVTVDAGGTFSGIGSVGGLNVAGTWTIPAFGGVPPALPASTTSLVAAQPLLATDPATLTIGGDLTTTDGAVVNIEATPGPKAPVQVGGVASFTGTRFNISVNDPSQQRLTSYALVSAGQVSLANSTATTQLDTLVPSLFADRTMLRVSVLNLSIPLVGVATTPNGRAVAEVIDALKPGTGELGGIIRNLAGLPDAELDEAFERLAGQVNVTDVKLAIIDSEAITDMIRSEVSASEDDDDPRYLSRATRPRWWTQITGQHARYGDRSGLRGALVNVGGAAGGFDVKRTDRFTFGVGGSLTQGGLSLRGLDEVSDMLAPRGFGYVGVRVGPFRFHGGGSAARTNGTSERQIRIAAARGDAQPVGSAFDRTAQSDQDGAAYDAWSEWQDTINIKTWRTESKVGWRHARFSRKAFEEAGAGPLSLVGAADVLTSTEADVLLRMWRREGAWRPHFLFSYRRQLGDDENRMKVGFVSNPNVTFDVNGLPLARNTVLGRTGLTLRTGSGLEYTVQYEFRHAESETRHTADFRIRFR
jgi:autotransporter-associated beta strand protein